MFLLIKFEKVLPRWQFLEESVSWGVHNIVVVITNKTNNTFQLIIPFETMALLDKQFFLIVNGALVKNLLMRL